MKKKVITSKRGRRFEEGGEVADKSAGLEASNKEAPVGFFERLRMGNIDDPSSEAYKRFGAGRGRAERIPVEDVTPTPVTRSQSSSETAPNRKKIYESGIPARDSGRSYIPTNTNIRESATENMFNSENMGVKNESGKYDTSQPSDSGSSVTRLSPYKDKEKKSAKPTAKTEAGGGRGSAASYRDYKDQASVARATAPTSRKGTMADIPGSSPSGWTGGTGERQDSTELERNIANTIMASSGLLRGAGAVKEAAKGATKAGGRALATAETPVTYLGKSGARQVGGGEEISAAARQALRNNPTKQLPKPAAKAAAKETKNLPYKKHLTEEDWTGGAIGYKRGGSVSKASSRADGIAMRGKTRGAMR